MTPNKHITQRGHSTHYDVNRKFVRNEKVDKHHAESQMTHDTEYRSYQSTRYTIITFTTKHQALKTNLETIMKCNPHCKLLLLSKIT